MLYRFLVVFFYRNANRYWQYSIGLCVSIIVACYDYADAEKSAQCGAGARHAALAVRAFVCATRKRDTTRPEDGVWPRVRPR